MDEKNSCQDVLHVFGVLTPGFLTEMDVKHFMTLIEIDMNKLRLTDEQRAQVRITASRICSARGQILMGPMVVVSLLICKLDYSDIDFEPKFIYTGGSTFAPMLFRLEKEWFEKAGPYKLDGSWNKLYPYFLETRPDALCVANYFAPEREVYIKRRRTRIAINGQYRFYIQPVYRPQETVWVYRFRICVRSTWFFFSDVADHLCLIEDPKTAVFFYMHLAKNGLFLQSEQSKLYLTSTQPYRWILQYFYKTDTRELPFYLKEKHTDRSIFTLSFQ